MITFTNLIFQLDEVSERSKRYKEMHDKANEEYKRAVEQAETEKEKSKLEPKVRDEKYHSALEHARDVRNQKFKQAETEYEKGDTPSNNDTKKTNSPDRSNSAANARAGEREWASSLRS